MYALSVMVFMMSFLLTVTMGKPVGSTIQLVKPQDANNTVLPVFEIPATKEILINYTGHPLVQTVVLEKTCRIPNYNIFMDEPVKSSLYTAKNLTETPSSQNTIKLTFHGLEDKDKGRYVFHMWNRYSGWGQYRFRLAPSGMTASTDDDDPAECQPMPKEEEEEVGWVSAQNVFIAIGVLAAAVLGIIIGLGIFISYKKFYNKNSTNIKTDAIHLKDNPTSGSNPPSSSPIDGSGYHRLLKKSPDNKDSTYSEVNEGSGKSKRQKAGVPGASNKEGYEEAAEIFKEGGASSSNVYSRTQDRKLRDSSGYLIAATTPPEALKQSPPTQDKQIQDTTSDDYLEPQDIKDQMGVFSNESKKDKETPKTGEKAVRNSGVGGPDYDDRDVYQELD